MQNLVYVMAFVAGAGVAVQVAVNSHMRSNLPNPMQATLLSFGVGTVIAIVWCAVARYPWTNIGPLLNQPWWAWTGGALGVAWILCSIVISKKIGVAPLFCIAVAGQLVVGMLIDGYGWFRAEPQTIPFSRIVGVGLVILGVVVVTASKRDTSERIDRRDAEIAEKTTE